MKHFICFGYHGYDDVSTPKVWERDWSHMMTYDDVLYVLHAWFLELVSVSALNAALIPLNPVPATIVK